MFIDAEVNHNKFGKGKIIDIEINSTNQLKSKVLVEFDSGKKSKFSITAFDEDGFFITNDDTIIPFIKTLKEEEFEKKKKALKEKVDKTIYIKSYHLNEIEKEVTKEDWEKAYKVADSYRFPNESRAVIMDSDLIFINASAAMRYMEARIKDCDKIYKACENGKKFMGSHWKYAGRESIQHIIDSFSESEE